MPSIPANFRVPPAGRLKDFECLRRAASPPPSLTSSVFRAALKVKGGQARQVVVKFGADVKHEVRQGRAAFKFARVYQGFIRVNGLSGFIGI